MSIFCCETIFFNVTWLLLAVPVFCLIIRWYLSLLIGIYSALSSSSTLQTKSLGVGRDRFEAMKPKSSKFKSVFMIVLVPLTHNTAFIQRYDLNEREITMTTTNDVVNLKMYLPFLCFFMCILLENNVECEICSLSTVCII